MLALLQAAGWPIWFLVLASVIATALIIERGLALRTRIVNPAGALASAKRLRDSIKAGNLPAPAAVSGLAQQGLIGAVLAAGLAHWNAGTRAIESAMETEAGHQAHELSRYLGALGTIAAVAPLLGLFGTVVGMIETFGAQTPTGMNPTQLAQGISIALYNTGLGIFVAIIALLAYRIYRAKVDEYLYQAERTATVFLKEESAINHSTASHSAQGAA